MADYRKTPSGRNVKYDTDPSNDYQDGYNAGRRYEPTEARPTRDVQRRPSWPWLLLLLLLLGLLAWWLLDRNGDAHDSNTHVSPYPSVTAAPSAMPSDNAQGTPATLPATGETP
jgi:hypothetical protein